MTGADQLQAIPLECRELITARRSLIMATVDNDGHPHASYTPFISDGGFGFYIFVSELAKHTPFLERRREVTVLLIEDEVASTQIFARRRASFPCNVERIPRTDAGWDNVVDRFADRFGPVVSTLRSLGDFVIFRLTPREGIYVKGFGQAYRLSGPELATIEHLRSTA